MRTTVVLACYNGAARIIRQMESLRRQTRKADCVLIMDDHSTDDTPEVVERYIREHHLQGWRLISNPDTLGWRKNFFRGMRSVDEGLVFLCDQDDEWLPDKIEKMAKVMEESPQIGVLACDYQLVYEPGSIRMRKYRKSRREREGPVSCYQFRDSFFMNPSPGCTYCMRSDLVRRTEGYWFPAAPHDEFIWLMALMEDGAFFCNETLMRLFRHGENTSDIRKKDIAGQKENLHYVEAMLDRLEQFAAAGGDRVAPEKAAALRGAKEWCRRRQRLMDNRNPLYWLGMAPYWKYYNSFRNCLSDLYLVLFGSFRRRA